MAGKHSKKLLGSQPEWKRLGLTGYGWEAEVRFVEAYAHTPTPWFWNLWENGKRIGAGDWATTWATALKCARVMQHQIVNHRNETYAVRIPIV